eukprot:316482-Amphidinium_carterae.2
MKPVDSHSPLSKPSTPVATSDARVRTPTGIEFADLTVRPSNTEQFTAARAKSLPSCEETSRTIKY